MSIVNIKYLHTFTNNTRIIVLMVTYIFQGQFNSSVLFICLKLLYNLIKL